MTWKPASVEWVHAHLREELGRLPSAHRRELEGLLVDPYSIPVESHPGESVVVVAEVRDQVLYWSDIEDGWELAPLTPAGGISERGSSQLELGYVARQLFEADGRDE